QANDEQLGSLYTHATALVFPSLMEGFGLPALEAVVSGTPVICSDIPAFREVLGPLGNYFSPSDVSGLRALLNRPLKKPTPEDQKRLLRRFSWRTMAEKTLQVYKSI
ncbi:glycosyltransferase, partial [Candidatus Roizmanbacteria bacterium]|nr:glycosyltransferase [Candidatus Roizmanbacteria bacterium]